MKGTITRLLSGIALLGVLFSGAAGTDATETAGTSPWGADDEIGRLNLITSESRAAVLSRVKGGEVYDLSVEFFIGMPSWQAAGDPRYRMWMTHTPHGTVVEALARQRVTLREGDVVLVRIGRMQVFEDAAAYMDNPPGIGMSAARFLAESSGAMIIGADNLSLEAFPSEVEQDYVPVHTCLLAQQGVPILEVVNLEQLSRDQVYEFAFIGGSLKLRGADGAPIRPIALPLDRGQSPRSAK